MLSNLRFNSLLSSLLVSSIDILVKTYLFVAQHGNFSRLDNQQYGRDILLVKAWFCQGSSQVQRGYLINLIISNSELLQLHERLCLVFSILYHASQVQETYQPSIECVVDLRVENSKPSFCQMSFHG
jgi:hypothetical protein